MNRSKTFGRIAATTALAAGLFALPGQRLSHDL